MSRVAISTGLILCLLACGETDNSAILADLGSPNPAVREDAVIEAASHDEAEVTEALERMLRDPDPRIRLAAVESLDKHDSPSSVRPLMERVLDPDADVSRAAIDTLARTGDPVAAPAIMAAISRHYVDPPLNAVWALGQLGDRDAIVLLARLRAHSDPWVRYNATEALREIE